MKTSLTMVSITFATLLLTGCASKTERQFVNGCKTGGIDGSTCSCIYQKLENKYGEDGLKSNLYTMHQTTSFQQDMIQSSMQCMQE